MRLAAVRDPLTFGKIRGTFERYWSGGDFEEFDAERFEDERHAAKRNGGGGDAAHVASNLLAIDLRPYPFQREILDQLHAEREVHGRDRALVVAATGTGKTVIAALDFARARREKADLSLLFIAHRKEILLKSRATFRHALRDTGFGELMVDGERPKSTRAVFASIQSLSAGAIEGLAPDAFDWVIVDEFHHAEAQSYRAILDRLRPRFLLGLTATPERADGRHVQETFFNGRITAEVRLWDALDRDLLAPFHYFAVADGTDLSGVRWTERGYTVGELGSVYMESRARVGVVLTALQRYVSDPSKMRAVGFCANVAHAEWMAEQFRDAGLAAKAIHGRTASAERD
ncbi:MAG: DEAD/DEAH box helicase family protein, partial [Planctomycetota bacterium]